MTARLIDGNALAAAIRAEIQPRVAAFARHTGRPPGLGIVLVGDNPASQIYVRNKLRSAAEVGMRAELTSLPATATIDDVLSAVAALNAEEWCDGLLVQDPLPDAIAAAARRVFDAVDPRKDVDGFHPVNVGKLVQKRPTLVPGTPLGVIEMLERSQIPIAGRTAVVIGRSDIVGKPMAMLLLHRDATVTICHSKTPNLAGVAAAADILVAAIGRPGFVTPELVKPGAAVIDVGITSVTDPAVVDRLFSPGHPRRAAFEKRGALVVGDVHPEVANVAGALTPVPGGVGPMTVAMLLSNVVKAAEQRSGGR